MDVKNLKLPGLMVLKPRRFSDPRGYFIETYNEKVFAAAGITTRFVQDNQSLSVSKGTVRGLHFQLPPAAQAKLVRVLQGSVYDVAIDLRVTVDPAGDVSNVALSHGGDKRLVRLAADAARGWKFAPARLDQVASAAHGFVRRASRWIPMHNDVAGAAAHF